MRARAGVIGMAMLIALTLPGTAHAARQTLSSAFTTRQPATSTGSSLAVDWRNPANAQGKPYAVKTIVTELPPGSVIDTSAIARCKASDAELMAQGASACPPASLVSTGTVLTDNGSPGGFPRFTSNKITNSNDDGELIGIAESEDPPTRVVSRAKVSGRTVTFGAPTLPGNPPPDPYTAFRELRLAGPALGQGGRPYTRTPPACPRSASWTTTFTFVYQDGASERTFTSSPCRRDLKPPRVRVRGCRFAGAPEAASRPGCASASARRCAVWRSTWTAASCTPPRTGSFGGRSAPGGFAPGATG